MVLTPSGFIAVLAGWFVAEVGRQPYVVYGLMRTADGVSPVPGGSVGFSLVLFFVPYMSIFGAGTWYMLRMIGRGPAVPTPEDEQRPGAGTPARTVSLTVGRIEPAESETPHMELHQIRSAQSEDEGCSTGVFQA